MKQKQQINTSVLQRRFSSLFQVVPYTVGCALCYKKVCYKFQLKKQLREITVHCLIDRRKIKHASK